MVIRKEDIHDLVERLPEDDQKTVFDFMQYLLNRSPKKTDCWEQIDQADLDDKPLSEEELRQLNSEAGLLRGRMPSVSSDYKLIYRKDAIKFQTKQEVSFQERIASRTCDNSPEWRHKANEGTTRLISSSDRYISYTF